MTLPRALAPLEALVGAPPLLEGEKMEDYVRLWSQIHASIEPQSFVEQISVRDITDLTWEIFRLRRMKIAILKAGGKEAAGQIGAFMVSSGSFTLPSKEARKIINAKLTIDDIHARALEIKLSEVERVETLIAQAETRRNLTLREIDRHRDVVARIAARVEMIEDAEFTEVAANAA